MTLIEGIEYRPMAASDVGGIPIMHQGDPTEVLARIAELGSSAVLAFDGSRHIGQLQFRRYERGARSPNGVWDPLYWMDFGDRAPELPPATLCLCCYHVGQLDETPARAERYQGRGIGAGLLDSFLEWARGAGCAAVIAKATPSRASIMRFLGGLPVPAYEARGFEIVSRWADSDLDAVVRQRRLVSESPRDDEATVACCVLRIAA